MVHITRSRAPKVEEPEELEEVPDTPDEVMEGETESEACDRIIAKYKAQARSPTKAIRAFCVTCMGGQVREVTRCTALQCVLYPFRAGRNPFNGRAVQKDDVEGEE